MPRTKKATSRGQSRGGCGDKGVSKYFVPSFIPFGGTEYSMQSEAINTQRQQVSWDSDRRLRHARINFVSATDYKHLKPTDPGIPLANMKLNDPAEAVSHDPKKTKLDRPIKRDIVISQEDDHVNLPKELTTELFVVDSRGGGPVATGFSPPQIYSPSSSSSDSSDEVILFRGRNNASAGVRKSPYLAEIKDSLRKPNAMVQDPIPQQQDLAAITKLNKERSASSRSQSPVTPEELSVTAKDDLLSTFLQPYQPTISKSIKSRYGSKARSRKSSLSGCSYQTKRDHEQALLEDYIRNIDTQGSGSEMACNQRNHGGTDGDTWQETDASSGNTFKNPPQSERLKLCELNNTSTSDERPGPVQAVLSKRNRKGEVHYLVVLEGRRMGEACWVSTSALTEAKSMTLIKQFETKKKLVSEVFDGGNVDSVSNSENDLTGDEGCGSIDDDIDLQQRNLDRIMDGQITRLGTKKAKFDIEFADPILLDGSSEIDICDGDVPIPIASNRPQYRLLDGSMSKRSKGKFPAASALADAYDGFDVMDFERPSLKNKYRGRKGKLAFDLSDSSLEATLQMTLENDRSKKKQRKMQRQELRAQGLLGKNDKPDLKVKYNEGMTIHDVKDEIKGFLISDKPTLALPPMEKADRKVVHEIATAFNLKSKSAGNGTKRFPVLYRTSFTSPYAESKFISVEARLIRRFLPRKDVRGKGQPFVSKHSGRGGHAGAAVTYKDGDIVGGSAPELGIENRGRAMLEKMGWSTGTALGALNNKGILEPVPHVVKTTKAGLG